MTMKKIDFKTLSEKNENELDDFIRGVEREMEFIKYGENYIIKNSNGKVVSEKEKLQLENNELILEDIKGCGCQGETTKKISKNKKRIKELEEKEVVDDTIEETESTI